MLRAQWRKLGTHWPMMFTVGVALYFLLSALDLPEHLPFSSDSADDSAHSAAIETNTSQITRVAASNFDVSVTSFRVRPDIKHPGSGEADFTLEVRNNGKANAEFRADQLTVREVGSTKPIRPQEAPTASVSPHLAVIVPVTFEFDVRANTEYELLYQGKRVFTGSPKSLQG